MAAPVFPELPWSATIADLVSASFNLGPVMSDPAHPPRFIRIAPDRWQINWQLSGVPEPLAQSIVNLYLSMRPVAPAVITFKP